MIVIKSVFVFIASTTRMNQGRVPPVEYDRFNPLTAGVAYIRVFNFY